VFYFSHHQCAVLYVIQTIETGYIWENANKCGTMKAECLAVIRVHSHCYDYESGYPCTVLVPVNTSLHVFQWWPFTLTQVLYEYALPVNFTRTSSF